MLGISASFYSAANALAPVIGGVLLGLLFVLALQAIKPGQEEINNYGAGAQRGALI